MSDGKTVLTELKDHVFTVTLNRPERLNAVNGVMHTELANLAREADNDGDVKVLG